MAGLTNYELTRRGVVMYQLLVNLHAISEDTAVRVGEVVDSQFNPVPPPDGGWPSRERATQVATSWLHTGVRLGYVRSAKWSNRPGARWRYWATPSA